MRNERNGMTECDDRRSVKREREDIFNKILFFWFTYIATFGSIYKNHLFTDGIKKISSQTQM